jgi:hypothetical protein
MSGLRRFLSAALLIVLVLVTPAPAFASVFDPDDVQSPLDIRFEDVDRLDHGKVRFTLIFHDRVPTWMLRKSGALIELDGDGDGRANFYVRFYRNSNGLLRANIGEYGSNVDSTAAHHPNAFTYRVVDKPWFLSGPCCESASFPKASRGRTESRKGRTIDRTRWVRE